EGELFQPGRTAMARVAQVCWGEGDVPAAMTLTGVLLCCGDAYSVPAAVVEAARDRHDEWINRERHSLDVEEAADFGVYPDRVRDIGCFHGASVAHHPLVAPTRYAERSGENRYGNDWRDLAFYRARQAAGEAYDPHGQPHALTRANLYTCRTPEY